MMNANSSWLNVNQWLPQSIRIDHCTGGWRMEDAPITVYRRLKSIIELDGQGECV